MGKFNANLGISGARSWEFEITRAKELVSGQYWSGKSVIIFGCTLYSDYVNRQKKTLEKCNLSAI